MNDSTTSISAGQVKVVISHKNLDNIAKYHILNRSSNLYFYGSLPKNGKNQFKFSDFKYDRVLKLKPKGKSGSKWRSEEMCSDGKTPLIEFVNDDVLSANDNDLPPYYIVDKEGKKWFLEQSVLVPDPGKKKVFVRGEKERVFPDCKEDCHIA